jgi:hypothetical protein
MKALLLALVLAGGLAGCAAPAGTRGHPGATQPSPRFETFRFTVAEAMAAGNRTGPEPFNIQTGPTSNPAQVNNVGPVKVRGNATNVLLEARFSCTSRACRYYVSLAFSNTEGKSSPSVDGTLRWTYDPHGTMDVGTWGFAIFPDGASIGMSGEVRVTVFYGQASVPDGFTAF